MLTGNLSFRRGLFRYSFRFSEPEGEALFRNPDFPELAGAKGNVVKDSATAFAARILFPGFPEPLFFKRTRNKGLRFTFRYLFREARSFRAARAAWVLLDSGVRTPRVLLAGEKKIGPVLLSGYAVTEWLPHAAEAAPLAKKADPESFRKIARRAAELLAQIHRAGVSHGDFKLQNVYVLENGEFGVLDLDGARVYASGTAPDAARFADLVRLVVSLVHEKGNDLSLTEEMAGIVLDAAGERFSVESLAESVRIFFRRRPPT